MSDTTAAHNCDGWDSCPNPAHRVSDTTAAGLTEAEREALADSIGSELYVSLMEASADQWRRWEFMTDAAKEKYRAEGARITADALTSAVERILADRLATVQAERDRNHEWWTAETNRSHAAEAERDAARAEVEALRERVGALAEGWETEANAGRAGNGHPLLVQTYAGHARDLRAALDADR